MKSKFLSFFLFFISIIKIVSAQNIFEETIIMNGNSTGYSVGQTNDGGYIITGDVNGGDVYLIKTGYNGDFLWAKSYGGPGYDGGFVTEQTRDSGFIIIATTEQSFGLNVNDVYLIHLINPPPKAVVMNFRATP